MNKNFKLPKGKTTYTLFAKTKLETTIKLDKWVADILQIELASVHESLERLFLAIRDSRPEISRRKLGDLIRNSGTIKANSFQDTKKKVLGWNDIQYIKDVFG